MAKFPTIDEMAKNIAEKVLDDYEYKGKTIRKWVELILAADVVEVIRCKDCEHMRMGGKPPFMYRHCKHPKGLVAGLLESDFCPYGERRSE